MTTLREAAQQALEALEGGADSWRLVDPAITALRAALAEPEHKPGCALLKIPSRDCDCGAEPVQEPVWLRVIDEAMVTHHLGVADSADDYEIATRKMNALLCHAQDIGAYFAAPPQRKPLTSEEVYVICRRTLPRVTAGMSFVPEWASSLARAIERAHGIGGQDE